MTEAPKAGILFMKSQVRRRRTSARKIEVAALGPCGNTQPF